MPLHGLPRSCLRSHEWWQCFGAKSSPSDLSGTAV
ncbi:hypothetical protein A2U01_0096286, partial [Trifolium medium]|nr:hypothetical protein [Trifolium medium]